jgi:hypothetical protein
MIEKTINLNSTQPKTSKKVPTQPAKNHPEGSVGFGWIGFVRLVRGMHLIDGLNALDLSFC